MTATTEMDEDTAPTNNSTALAGIASMLEDHRASISADFKSTFAALESKLERLQTMMNEHGERVTSLETHAELQDQRIQALEERCVALASTNAKLIAKTADLENRSLRNNIRIVGLPESVEGPRPTSFFADLLVEVFGNQILQSPPELDRAHRALVAKPKPDSRPRPVILCLHQYQTKDLIIREARSSQGKLQYRVQTN